jgi:hypothetical protein
MRDSRAVAVASNDSIKINHSITLVALGKHGTDQEDEQKDNKKPGAAVEVADQIRELHSSLRILQQRAGRAWEDNSGGGIMGGGLIDWDVVVAT